MSTIGALFLLAADTGLIFGIIFAVIVVASIGEAIFLIVRRAKKKKAQKQEEKRSAIVTNNKVETVKETPENNELCDKGACAFAEGDEEGAYKYYYAAHLKGSARGSFYAGHLKGREKPFTYSTLEEQIDLFRTADQRGFPYAASMLTSVLGFDEDEGTERHKEALKIFATLPQKNDPCSHSVLAGVYFGWTPIVGIEENEEKGLLHIEKLASFADAFPYVENPSTPKDIENNLIMGLPKDIRSMMFLLGKYYYGQDGKESEAKGLKYLLKSVEAPIEERARAYMLIADCYVSGFGTTVDLKEAERYFRLSLSAGMDPHQEDMENIKDKILDKREAQARINNFASDSSQREKDFWGALAEAPLDFNTSDSSDGDDGKPEKRKYRIVEEKEYMGNKYMVLSDGTPVPQQYKVIREDGDKVLLDMGSDGFKWVKRK